MSDNVVEGVGGDPVIQFSVFLENKVGRLSDFSRLLADNSIHIMAMTVLDTTDSSIVRIIVDDPGSASSVLYLAGYSFSETDVLVIELSSVDDVPALLSLILAAEINVHYLYPFIFRPSEKSALAIQLEDMDLATDVLKFSKFRVLCQSDISR
ncbi:MAG: acetolactate synthase [Verrucomicrobia bacterium]|nr:acetolactate synthase [Verrucomicrobiota bacterium]MDA1067901.1 acetolactate synthase [Verrucomicrobiota bacterium]